MNEYMKEAERLLDEYKYAAGPYGHDIIHESARAALLAHIQRGAAPEGNERDEWEAVVFTLMGHAASLYFLGQSDMPNWFYELAEKLARRHVDEALADRVREVVVQQCAMLAATPAPATAEVPMPKPDRVTQIGDKPRFYSHSADQLRKYGIACRAAGEAAGYARAANWLRSQAEKHAMENGYHESDTGSFVFASRAAEEWNNSVLELADEMEAAMREEVK